MTERERWIVYPLLFLALGAALRDKLAKLTRAENIVCQRVVLVDSEGRPQAEMSGDLFRLGSAEVQCTNLQAFRVNAQSILQQGRPIGGEGQGVSWPQLLQFLQQLGAINLVPGAQAAPPPDQGILQRVPENQEAAPPNDNTAQPRSNAT